VKLVAQQITPRSSTQEQRVAAREFADQVAESGRLRIQCVNHVFALTHTFERKRDISTVKAGQGMSKNRATTGRNP
jgi:hypothetical protein